jgi:hypothetical protein
MAASSTLVLDPAPALAPLVPRAPDRDPVAVYLARLGTDKSRRTMRGALDRIAAEFGAPSPHAIDWGALRYPHAAALRARLAPAAPKRQQRTPTRPQSSCRCSEAQR